MTPPQLHPDDQRVLKAVQRGVDVVWTVLVGVVLAVVGHFLHDNPWTTLASGLAGAAIYFGAGWLWRRWR